MQKKLNAKIIFAAVAIIFLFCLLLCYPVWYHIFPEKDTNSSFQKVLKQEALKALESRDVTIAAIVVYGDSIIGKGYNTVLRDTAAGGHAEINAISDAIRRTGFENFMQLDRDSLLLLSTYEPCPMCAGACLIYNIKHVGFLKGKDINHNLAMEYRRLRYFASRRQYSGSTLQDSLFWLHPDYPGRKK